MEQQTQYKVHYMDLTIINNKNDLSFEIYRKPTSTDLILHNTSCHPYERKKSAINYMLTKEIKTKKKKLQPKY
jgi:hypothetical protein